MKFPLRATVAHVQPLPPSSHVPPGSGLGPTRPPIWTCAFCGFNEEYGGDPVGHSCKGTEAARESNRALAEAIEKERTTPRPCLDCGTETYAGQSHECTPKPDATAKTMATMQADQLVRTLREAGYEVTKSEES